jgi:chromosome segregation ATPase
MANLQKIMVEWEELKAREEYLNKHCSKLNQELKKANQELQAIRSTEAEIEQLFNVLQELSTGNVNSWQLEIKTIEASSSTMQVNGSSSSAPKTTTTTAINGTKRNSSCKQCSAIHKKCDKTLPVCNACLSKGLQCEYLPRKNRKRQ